MRRRRGPRPVAETLQAVLQDAEPATLLAAVQRAWSDAVGEAIAAEASPVSEREGVVTVSCRSATWAQELELLGDQITARLRSEIADQPPLEALRFNASPERRK